MTATVLYILDLHKDETILYTCIYSTYNLIPATVFPWQRTPATRDTLHEVMVEYVQSMSRDSFP